MTAAQLQFELFESYDAKPRYDLHAAPVTGGMCNILTYAWKFGRRFMPKGPCSYPGRGYKVKHLTGWLPIDVCLFHAVQVGRRFDIDVAPAAIEH